MTEMTSLIAVEPVSIATRVDAAVAICEQTIEDVKADIREAYSKMSVRCGFLWLRTRLPTPKEVSGRLAASRDVFGNCYDSAWNTVYGLRNDLTRLKNIQDALRTGSLMAYLSIDDLNMINLYQEKKE